MDFSRTEEQKEVSQLSGRIFKDKLTEDRRKELNASGAQFDARLWKDLASSGTLGTAIPDAYGGSEYGLLELCSLMIEAARVRIPWPW